MLKTSDKVTVNWLKVSADQIWESKIIPKDWKRQIVIPIHKNDSKPLSQNYRGISLTRRVFGREVQTDCKIWSTGREPHVDSTFQKNQSA